MCDSAILVVDLVEGVTMFTENLIKHLVSNGLPFIVVLNKIDRLIIELKLTPEDAFLKIR